MEKKIDTGHKETGRFRTYQGGVAKLITLIAATYCLYSFAYVLGFFTTRHFVLMPGAFVSLALALLLILVFLLVPATKGAPKNRLPWYDLVLILASIVVTLYIFINFERLIYQPPKASTLQIILGSVCLVVLLEAARRIVGPTIPGIALFFLFYALFSNHFPGFLESRGYPVNRIMADVYLSEVGIFGGALQVVISVVFVFIVFGVGLQVTGGTKLFVDLALALFGRVTGGPAKVAVVASGLMGMISGSPLANAATVGVVTIPMMINAGYRPFFAAAVEAVASTGGVLMPPVMGVTAFLMAEFLRIPYVSVCIAAALSAILYYWAAFVMIHIEAVKTGLRGLPPEQLPSITKTLKEGWQFILPLIALVYLLAVRAYSAETACMYALAILVVVSMFKKETRLTPKKIIAGLEQTGRAMIDVGPVSGCIGIIIACISLTGLGMRMSAGLVGLAGGNLTVFMVMAAIASLILGMGVPALSSYVLLAFLVVPALTMLHVTPLAAHMFVLYFSTISFITPPVALAVFITSGIAGSTIMRTGYVACKLGIIAFVVPFMFIYNPALLCIGPATEIAFAAVTAIIGCVALGTGLGGYLLRQTNWVERLFLTGGGLLLIYPGLGNGIAGVAIFGGVCLWQRATQSRVQRAEAAAEFLSPEGD